METLGESRHEGTTRVRTSPGSFSPHIQIEDQDGTKTSIRKAQREEYRRKKSKINNEDSAKDYSSGLASENENMEEAEERGEQAANIKEIRGKIKAVLRCIEIAHLDSSKKAPTNYDKTELYQFVEALERRITLQLEKNLMLAEQNLCLAEQALFLSNNKEEKQDNDYQSGVSSVEKKLYSEILMKESTLKMQGGLKLPTPMVPAMAKHFPSDCVIIIKGNRHGRIPTGNELRRDKEKICRQIGNLLASEILVIRTTRSGGYIVALKSPAKREEIKTKLINEEMTQDKIILPKAKLPKVICKEITDDFTLDDLIRDLHSWKNQKLQNIPPHERKAKVTQTRLGLVMELSSSEVMAIELQDWRIRYGYGNEIRVEEFIPIQQCYNCSCFGHSADNCENMPRCRLCASSDHSGRECSKRNDKTQWKCTNCLDSNLRRNTKLNCNHGAAQLHKCQIAINEKEIKRQQMANEGIYISKGTGWRTGAMQKSGNTNELMTIKDKIYQPEMNWTNAQRSESLETEKLKKKYSETDLRSNIAPKTRVQEAELMRKNGNGKSLENESELENEEEESEMMESNQQVRGIDSQRRGFGVISERGEENVVDGKWYSQRRGRSRSTVRQRSVSRIRRSGIVAKPLHHTRSTTSLGEAVLAYSPIKRRDMIRRGRPARSGEAHNEEEGSSDLGNRRMTPRSEGHGARFGRIGGYVDRRGVESHKDSDDVMSAGGETAAVIKGKDRNDR